MVISSGIEGRTAGVSRLVSYPGKGLVGRGGVTPPLPTPDVRPLTRCPIAGAFSGGYCTGRRPDERDCGGSEGHAMIATRTILFSTLLLAGLTGSAQSPDLPDYQ